MFKFYLILPFFYFQIVTTAYGQKALKPTYGKDRLESFEQRKKLQNNSLLSNLKFESVGPTVMSGRVVDVDASPKDPTIFYAAYASGGLWFTRNNGQSFEPLFDYEAVMTIGDIAVDWDHGQTIWIGTGENNSSRSSYAGMGIYKSDDTGATWQWMGLPNSHHISRILIHPKDPNIVWVAVLGSLYSPNEERGVYKTVDGGKTWLKTLYVNDITGAVDLAFHSAEPDILYAAMWERDRKAWNFTGAGKGSSIYKSIDGGNTWSKITGNNGFPSDQGVGRIGLAVSQQHPEVVYAILDNQNRREEEKEDTILLTKEQLRNMSKEDFFKLDKSLLEGFLSQHNFPKEYQFEAVNKMIANDEIKPITLVEYLEDANAQLFDTPVKSAEVYRSGNGGKTWHKTHEGSVEDLYYSYGYYFGQIRIAPENDSIIYIAGVPLLMSKDGGATFESISRENVHADHHALWLNPFKPGHMINGNDGGINISYDYGKNWFKANNPPVGQVYAVNIDMAKPYNIYAGLQDNGVWRGASNHKLNNSWHQTGDYPYAMILGGDGMQIEIDTRDNNIIYSGYQFGNYFKIKVQENDGEKLHISHGLKERPLRYNWQTPIHLSKHNQDILYIGSNKFHRSMDQGKSFETLSGDLTKGGKKGNVSYGTITTIDESPLKFGLLYIGTDDGLVHRSDDGGYNWINISKGLPSNLWVSRVEASNHDKNIVYATLNGYRADHFDPYIYRSTDQGKKWTKIGLDLPKEPVNVIKEDPENPNILYIGTDNGLYVSLNKGVSFMATSKDLPSVAVHDLVIHPRDHEIIVGTHGRSIYKANISHLQKLDNQVLADPLTIFEIDDINYNPSWGDIWNKWHKPVTPKVNIGYYLKDEQIINVEIVSDSIMIYKMQDTAEVGLNYLTYDLTIQENELEKYKSKLFNKEIKLKTAKNGNIYLLPGEYTVVLSVNGNDEKQQIRSTKFTIKELK